MRYFCNRCGREIKELRTEGDSECYSFLCPECSQCVQLMLKTDADRLAKNINETYHIR